MATVPSKHTWDFSNVSEGSEFSPKRMPAGDYLAKVVKWTTGTSKNDNPQWIYTITLVDNPRAVYPYYVGLDENSAWKMRNLLVAAGISVPKKRATVPGERVVGKKIGITLEDDEFNGREKSTVQAVFPVSELDTGTEEEETDEDVVDEEEEEEEAPAPRKRAAKKAPAKKAPAKRAARRSEPEEEEDDLDDLDLDEL